MITAVQCRYKTSETQDWKHGLAITSARGLSDVVAIIPHDATTRVDILQEVWDYRLLWTDGILELEQPQ